MKKLIACAALLAASAMASAENIAWLPNKGGGQIILRSEPCQGPGVRRLVISRLESGETFTGCWFYDDLLVHVKWDSGKRYTYPISEFTLIEPKTPTRDKATF